MREVLARPWVWVSVCVPLALSCLVYSLNFNCIAFFLFVTGGIMCFTCPVFEREEDGYKAKCESLKEEGKWTLHTNKEADYYGDKPPRGRGYKTCRLLVYKKV